MRPSPSVLKMGQINGDFYRLERRRVYQGHFTKVTYVIVDFAGDLYAFLDLDAAAAHWREMGICAFAEQEAA